MTSKEIDEILKSPITQSAKGRFISIEQLEQIKNKLEESEQQLNYTLSKCIKEWEERGFIVNNNDFYIFLHHEQHCVSMVIEKKEMKYHTYYGYISLELSELLHKTLKALEVENGK